MAESVEIPIDVSGFDKLISGVEGVTKSSKEMGDSFKRALLGEVVTNGIQRIAAGMKDGIAKETTAAIGVISQGFFQGGPVGAALAATSITVGVLIDRFDLLGVHAERTAVHTARLFAEAADVAADSASRSAALARGIRLDLLDIEEERAHKAREVAEAADKARAEANKKRGEDTLAYIREQDEALSAAQSAAALDAQNAEIAAFDEQQAIEAEQAQAARDAKDAEAAEDRDRQKDRDAEEIRLYNLKNEQIAKAQHDVLEADKRAKKEADDRLATVKDGIEGQWAALGNSAATSFTNGIGNAVQAVAMLDAAQIAAAASSKDFGNQMAASAARGVQAILASIAQQATVKSLFNLAEGIAASAIGAGKEAGEFFAASAAFAGTALLAGGGGVLAGTIASSVAPPAASSPGRSPALGSSTTTTPREAPVVRVEVGQMLSTADDIGAAVDASLKKARRYGR